MNRHQALKTLIGGMVLPIIPPLGEQASPWACSRPPDLVIDARDLMGTPASQVWGDWLVHHQQRDQFRKPYLLELWKSGTGYLIRFTSMHRIEVDGIIGTHVVPGTFRLARETWWKWLPSPLPL